MFKYIVIFEVLTQLPLQTIKSTNFDNFNLLIQPYLYQISNIISYQAIVKPCLELTPFKRSNASMLKTSFITGTSQLLTIRRKNRQNRQNMRPRTAK